MNDEKGVLFMLGIVVGIIISTVAVNIYNNSYDSACREKHNVYECEWQYSPVVKNG